MSEKVIWVIDDELPLLSQVRQTLDSVEWDTPLRVLTSRNWNLSELQAKSGGRLPDVVVLDLYDAGDLVADAFYEELRKIETAETRSFVILHSSYMGMTSAQKFIQQAQPEDNRLVVLETRDARSLRNAVTNCLRRIREEDEW